MSLQAILLCVMLFAFMVWLGVIVNLIFWVLQHPDRLDPFMALFTGAGVGGVTSFFMLHIKDAWQFFFRKKPPLQGGGK